MIYTFEFNVIASSLAAVFFSSGLYAQRVPDPVSKATPSISLAFDCNKQAKLCAHGRLPRGRGGWLIDPEGHCRILIGDTFTYVDQDASFPATRLIEKTKCPITTGASILYLKSDFKSFEFLASSPIKEAKVVASLTSKLKSEGLIKKAVGDKDKSGTEGTSNIQPLLEKGTPKLFAFHQEPWKGLSFMSLTLPTHKNRGLLLAFSEKETVFLTGACGYPESAQYFTVNNTAFIRVKNSWCGTDDDEHQIYEVKEGKPHLIYSNDELPDLDTESDAESD